MRKLSMAELNRLTPDQYKASDKTPLIIVLDHVRSLNNVGSVFRTADAFRLEAIYLCGVTATPPDAEIRKTALGAEEVVEWRYFKETMEAVRELKSCGYTLCALEQAENSIPVGQFRPDGNQKYAVIIGHEVKGVDQQVIDACNICLEIPQHGVKHSLNVAVAAGIIIWEMFRLLTSTGKIIR